MYRLLLANHHPPTLGHLREELLRAGYAVHATSDPALAMEHAAAEALDAVLVSIDFPKLSGKHLCQLLRAHEQTARVPVIALDHGHLARPRGVSAILDLKANAYVVDPMKIADLKAKLAGLLGAPAGVSKAEGMQAVLARPPVASGDLKELPLPGLFHSFYRQQRDGILVIACRDLTRRLYFLKGAPVSYDSSARQDSFPRFLHDQGAVREEEADQIARSLAGGLRISTALADAGVALHGEELLARLREYVLDKAAQVVGMREGRYAFYAGDEFAHVVAKVDVPALAPVLAGARRSFPLRICVRPLRMRGAQYPYRTPEFGADLPALGLDTQDLRFALELNGRLPLRDLWADGRTELRAGCTLLWFLLLCGDAGLSEKPLVAPEPATDHFPAERIAPRRRKKLPAEKMAELRDAAVKILTGSYFQVLGLDITADVEAVEKAYHEVGSRFHPDTYAEHDTSDIKDLLESVQDKLAGSYRVLSVDEKRKAYVQYLCTRLDLPRASAVHVDAEIALKRGELAMKRKDYVTARLAFEEAISLNGREPEYYSYLAWVTYLAGGGDRKKRARAAQKILRKALAMSPYLERPQVISAIIDMEQGNATSAHRKLIRVLELNPRSALAKAALRKARR